MITRYMVEITHDHEPVDGDLISVPGLMNAVLNLAGRTEDDDVDVGITGVHVSKQEGGSDDHAS